MSGMGAGPAGQVRPFPAIDPEPPPGSRRPRAVVAGASAALVAASGPVLALTPWPPAGPAITVFSLDGGTVTIPVAAEALSPRCLWSPNRAAVLCSTGIQPSYPTGGWTVAPASGGPAVTVRGPGFSLSWAGAGGP